MSARSGSSPTTCRRGRTTRLRIGCRGLIVAARVSLQQLGALPDRTDRPDPPYVLLLSEEPPGLSPREIVDDIVLTEALELSDPDKP